MPRIRTTADRSPRFVPLIEAAEYGHIPPRTLREWISRGIVPAYRVGPRLIQVDLNDMDALRRRIPTVGGDAA